MPTLRAARIEITEDSIARGLASLTWPARFQRWDERTIIDGAHNPSGARILARTWQETFPNQRATVVIAVLQDKDVVSIVRAISPIAQQLFLPKIKSVRGLAPEALAEFVSNITPRLPCSISSSIEDAIGSARAQPYPILITGSLHFAGEALAYLQGVPAAYEECLQ